MKDLKRTKMEYYTRHILTDKGIKELKVSKEIADKQIKKLLKADREMLEVLEKL